MLKIPQARLQQYINHELPHVQAGFRKGRGTRDQIANICCIIEKARESQKNIYFCFIDYTKVFDCVDHNKLWKILQETGIPEHLICLLRNLYMQVKNQQFKVNMEKQTGSQLGKEHGKVVYCHSVYLTSMQSSVQFSSAQSCPTLCDPMDCSLPGSSVHGIFQAIVLEWIAISFSRGSFQPRD